MIEPRMSHETDKASNSRSRSLSFPISQICIQIRRTSVLSIQDEVLRWIAKRAGRSLPAKAWQGEAFSLEEIGAQHAEVCKLSSPHFWAARFDDADKTVPSRTWVTEAALAEREDKSIVFGARLTAVIRGTEAKFERSVPGFVRQITSRFESSLDGIRLADTPWLISSSADVPRLVALLLDANRKVDVIVIATAENSSDVSTTIIDAFDLAKRLTGAAHVAVITSEASFALSDHLGKEFSVFRQAVRTYKPSFKPEYDEPFAHPLGLPRKILNWEGGGPDAYARFVSSQALLRTVSSPDLEKSVPSFLEIKRAAVELRFEAAKNAGSSDTDLLALFEQDNNELRDQMRQQRDTSDALLVLAESERLSALETVNQTRETIRHLLRRIASLQEARNEVNLEEVNLPKNFESIQEWCSNHLAGSVELHGRAFRGLKNSEYEDTTLVYNALLLLRDHYVPMRREGGSELVEEFKRQCALLSLEEESTGSETRAGEQGDEYYVGYAGRRCYLDRHLKKGSSREPRYCFRLYFFWDEDAELVIVGWLPSHLDSRIT